MCKSSIEKAAKAAGATTAEWNKDSKALTVTYNSTSTNTAKIQQKIAESLKIPVSKVYGVVTFYSYFSLEPKGKYGSYNRIMDKMFDIILLKEF